MSDTTFSAGTVVASSWLNDLNDFAYNNGSQATNKAFVTPYTYGGVGNGTNNDTAALQDFIDACMAGAIGFWPAGTWMVDEGELVIQPASNVHTPGPVIHTAGYKATILKGRGTTEAPLLTIQNLTQVSGAGKFLKGGYLGALGFDGTGQPGGWTASHGLSIRGIDGWQFGYLNGESLRGDVVRIPLNLYDGYNPDPYHVAFCVFHGIQGNFCSGWTLNNANYVGFTSCFVQNLACYGTSTGFGALRSCGAGNSYQRISVGTCYGWAIDIYDGATGGRASREVISMMELDDPEYGVRIVNADQSVFDQIRIVHRYHSTGTVYWPRTALELSNSGSTAAVSNCEIEITHRIEAGGVKANLGKFLEANNSSAITGVSISYRVNDNASFGISNTDLLTSANIASSATMLIESSLPVDQTVIFDSRYVPAMVANATGTVPVLSGGFGTSSNKVLFATAVYNPRGDYSVGTSTYTVPVTGVYRVTGTMHLTGLVAGNRVRVGLFDGTTTLAQQEHLAQGTGRQGYTFNSIVSLTRGNVVYFNADTNNGSTKNLDITGNDNHWEIQLLQVSTT